MMWLDGSYEYWVPELTVCESVVSDVVGWRVGKVEEQGSNASGTVLHVGCLCSLQSFKGDGDGNEGNEHQAG